MEQNGLTIRLAGALGSAVVDAKPLAVGFGLTGLEVRLADGRHLAVKARAGGEAYSSDLTLEAYMLGKLARRSELPVPRAHHAEPGLQDWSIPPSLAAIPRSNSPSRRSSARSESRSLPLTKA